MGRPWFESRPEHISSVRPEGRAAKPSCRRGSRIAFAKLLQYILAQKIGIALALFRELDDAPGDYFVAEIASVCKAKGRTRHLEGDPHDPFGLRIECEAAEEWSDGHDASLRRGSGP